MQSHSIYNLNINSDINLAELTYRQFSNILLDIYNHPPHQNLLEERFFYEKINEKIQEIALYDPEKAAAYQETFSEYKKEVMKNLNHFTQFIECLGKLAHITTTNANDIQIAIDNLNNLIATQPDVLREIHEIATRISRRSSQLSYLLLDFINQLPAFDYLPRSQTKKEGLLPAVLLFLTYTLLEEKNLPPSSVVLSINIIHSIPALLACSKLSEKEKQDIILAFSSQHLTIPTKIEVKTSLANKTPEEVVAYIWSLNNKLLSTNNLDYKDYLTECLTQISQHDQYKPHALAALGDATTHKEQAKSFFQEAAKLGDKYGTFFCSCVNYKETRVKLEKLLKSSFRSRLKNKKEIDHLVSQFYEQANSVLDQAFQLIISDHPKKELLRKFITSLEEKANELYKLLETWSDTNQIQLHHIYKANLLAYKNQLPPSYEEAMQDRQCPLPPSHENTLIKTEGLQSNTVFKQSVGTKKETEVEQQAERSEKKPMTIPL